MAISVGSVIEGRSEGIAGQADEGVDDGAEGLSGMRGGLIEK